MKIEFRSNLRRRHFSPARTRGFLNRALVALRQRGGEISIVFCGDGLMRRLNREYRGKDGTTDVLSFPAGTRNGFLGDLVVSVPEARRQARRDKISFDGVMRKLLLHGLLHLLGYDHEVDNGEMDALEARLRQKFSIPS